MPKRCDPSTHDLTPQQRLRQISAILAAGVMRTRHIAQLAENGQLSPPRNMDLEVVSEMRLSVSKGSVWGAECEVNDGRTA
jgi:hypothetical protein